MFVTMFVAVVLGSYCAPPGRWRLAVAGPPPPLFASLFQFVQRTCITPVQRLLYTDCTLYRVTDRAAGHSSL